ncbi:putative 2-oxoglutarate/Fe(II)-dependent dioxygenase YbiX [Humitalea rosea]|uniref:Putative 2-oxoglutarate/Fe(II)-dependent dioxygenase YbiX n=1 Tax=Humitalea rosea TaxID=990373 RepID=A0A2W7IC56_9PROT|nr:2OG-Fe(II) oxygenase [Humitalea rosea]PZW43678.1 putative 2-oxoglutarate/Fe(II)-dependent dioxygenase YbiX [Humitalea rosea]
MAIPPPFLPGDHLPPLSLPDAAGQAFDLFQQSIAGQHRLLLLRPDAAPVAATLPPGVLAYAIHPTAPDGRTDVPGPPRLFDPDRRLLTALALPGGGIATITPRGRLGWCGSGDGALAGALASLAPDSAAGRSFAPVLLIPGVLEPALCAALIRHWEQGEKSRDRVASSAGGAGAGMVPGIKRRADVMLDDSALYALFQQRIERRVLPEMWRAFRFRAARFEAPRIGCYAAENAGAFGAHRDNRTPYTAHRRFAMSLNLNTGAYAGGALRFPEFGPEAYEPEAGGCAIFCCDLLHEALPVTRGARMAVFTFFTDAEGAAAEQRLIAAAEARGEAGVKMR